MTRKINFVRKVHKELWCGQPTNIVPHLIFSINCNRILISLTSFAAWIIQVITLYPVFLIQVSSALYNLSVFLSLSGFNKKEWTKSCSNSTSDVEDVCARNIERTTIWGRIRWYILRCYHITCYDTSRDKISLFSCSFQLSRNITEWLIVMMKYFLCPEFPSSRK